MSGIQLRQGVSFLDFLPQSTFINNSEFSSYQNGSSPSTFFYPVLLPSSDGRNQTLGGTDVNNTILQKREINSFYFYKVRQF